jgi:hypothetical protein
MNRKDRLFGDRQTVGAAPGHDESDNGTGNQLEQGLHDADFLGRLSKAARDSARGGARGHAEGDQGQGDTVEKGFHRFTHKTELMTTLSYIISHLRESLFVSQIPTPLVTERVHHNGNRMGLTRRKPRRLSPCGPLHVQRL